MKNVSRRNFLKTLGLGGGMAAGAAVLAACGGGGAAPAAPAGAPAAPVTLDIGTKGDTLEYDKTALDASAGSKITVNLKNNSAPASNLLHNWALLKAGAAIDAVANDGIAAGDANNYIKAGDDRVLAHVKLVKGGETGSVTFDAPAAGVYDYLCTFPGHNVLMRGKLTIK